MELSDLISALASGGFRVTDHADESMSEDGSSLDEIVQTVLRGEIIEGYPSEQPYPRFLVYGDTDAGDPVHSVWAYNDRNGWATLVTVYRPDPRRWVNWRQRRR